MSSYYVVRDGTQAGPYEEFEILQHIAEGRLGPNDLCWREGMGDWQPILAVMSVPYAQPSPPPILVSATSPFGKSGPLFLRIPPSRLVILSILSMSLYEAYWIYKNWRYIKERDGLNIKPFWRGWFGLFYCHSLLRRIHEDTEARAVQPPSFSPSGLATGWVVLLIASIAIGRAPSIAASIIAALIPSSLCLVPVQSYINTVSEKRNPGEPYYGWSFGHIVCLVYGIIIWTLLLIGLAAT